MILSKQRRNHGPKQTKILVTNLPEVSARQVVDVYRRRWSVELLFKELKGATGLGQHQVTKDPQRIERSIAISIMAYLMLLKFRAHDIPKHGSWSAFTLKRNFTWQLAWPRRSWNVLSSNASLKGARSAKPHDQPREPVAFKYPQIPLRHFRSEPDPIQLSGVCGVWP